ncbi:MAG: acetate--CoA ligase family protein, partial [Candidatus Omnitrophota bacterium]
GVLVSSFIEKASPVPSELIIGFSDSESGGFVRFGEGGWGTDYREDDACRSYLPYMPFSAKELISATKIGRTFVYGKDNYRGKRLPLKPEKLESLIEMLVAFKRYYDENGKYDVWDFEINPFICDKDGELFACDAKLQFRPKKHPKKVRLLPKSGMDRLFEPNSIAIIGAVTDSDAKRVHANILNTVNNIRESFGEYSKIYLYLTKEYAKPGRKTSKVKTYKGIPFVEEIPDDCDLYVVLKPPGKGGIAAVKDILAKGKPVIMIGAGVEEVESGADLARQLKDAIESAVEGGCVLGPNSMGFVGPYNATFPITAGVEAHKESNIALIAQSGVFLSTGITSLTQRNTRVHYGISIGNATDLKAADYLEYILKYKQQIKVLGMYLEDSGGERLLYWVNEARKRGVSVIISKGGTTKQGAKAAASHTASMAGEFKTFKQLFEQAGAIVFANTDDDDMWPETVYAASYFAKKGFPKGNIVAGVNLGGVDAVTMTDAIELSEKLESLKPDRNLYEHIKKLKLPNDIKFPLDATAAAGIKNIKKLLGFLDTSKQRKQFDMIVFAYLQWLTGTEDDKKLMEFIKNRGKDALPLIFANKDYSDEGIGFTDHMQKKGFLVFSTPNRAIRAISAIMKSRAAITEPLSADVGNLVAPNFSSAVFTAPLLDHRRNPMVIEAINAAA